MTASSSTDADNFGDRLTAAVLARQTPTLVGLDPRWESLPSSLREGDTDASNEQKAQAYVRFCQGIVDVVSPLVPAVKPQAAFFEALGPAGTAALFEVIQYASAKGLLVVLDGKRNDIGSTATAYAQAYLGREDRSAWGADSLTVSPYLGDDSLSPFVTACDDCHAGIFVLVKTSNPGGKFLQDLLIDGEPMYRRVASLVQQLSTQRKGTSGYGPIGAVVGATYPQQLSELRQAMPSCWLLVPGFGAQGGSAADVADAFDDRGLGAIVNSSRGIIFAHQRDAYRDQFGESRWQEAVEAATLAMIDQLRAETGAGRLKS